VERTGKEAGRTQRTMGFGGLQLTHPNLRISRFASGMQFEKCNMQ